MTFDEAVDFVLRSEYGYFGHPLDSEGETNFKASKRFFNEERAQSIIGSDIASGSAD